MLSYGTAAIGKWCSLVRNGSPACDPLSGLRHAGRRNGRNDPCELVGQSDGDQSRGLARKKRGQPISPDAFPRARQPRANDAAPPQSLDRDCFARHARPSDGPLALFGDRARLLNEGHQMPLMRGEPPKDLAAARVLRCVAPSQAEKSRPDSNTRRSDALAAISAACKAALAMSGSGALVAALAIGASTRPIPLEAKRPNFARWPRKALPLSLLLDRQPTRLDRINAACRAALLLGANRVPGRNMASARPLARRSRYGPFSAITDSADPTILPRTSRFRAKCGFSHGLCIIPVRQHSAFYGQDIGNHR
jgi:hypothetical protein